MVKLMIDFRYVEIEYELWALGKFLDLLEPHIKRLTDQDKLQTLAELREKGWDHDEAEVEFAYQELHECQEHVIPRFMRGPFIVSLWACFEAGVSELAEGRRLETKVALSLIDIRGDNFLKRARRYFEAVLGLPLDEDQARYERLCDLLRIRNSLAHANGQRSTMSQERWDSLTKALKRQGTPPDDNRGLVILTDAYLRKAYDDVNSCLQSLVSRIRGRPAVTKLDSA